MPHYQSKDSEIDTSTDKVLAIIMGSGRGSRLYNLTKLRSKPAVSFGGEPRIIDVKLTKLVDALIRHIHVMVEYEPNSLLKHLNRWNNREFGNGDFVIGIPNKRSALEGIAESLYGHLYERHPSQLGFDPSEYMVLTGDHATDLDMRRFLRFHRQHDADITLAVKAVPTARAAGSLGAVLFDKDNRIKDFVEKSPEPPYIEIGGAKYTYASLMDSIWKPEILDDAVKRFRPGCQNSYDLSKDLLTPLIRENDLKVCAYVHEGYWADVGILDELIFEILSLTRPDVGLDIGKIRTFSDKHVTGPIIGPKSVFENFKPSAGDLIYGATIMSSVLGYSVTALEGSFIRDSIVSDDSVIGARSSVIDSYLDKNVRVGENAFIGPESLDIRLDERGHVIGSNMNGYRLTPLGATYNRPADHLLLQKSFCDVSVEEMVGSGESCDGDHIFIPELDMYRNRSLEMVLTPGNKVVVSRNSWTPEGYRI